MGFFETVLNEENGGDRRHLEALLGRAKAFEKMKKYDLSLEVLSEVSVMHKGFTPALVEKSKIHIFNGDWDLALDTVQQVLFDDRQNVEGLRIYIFYLLSRETDLDLVIEKMGELMDAMKRNEPKNAELYYNLARLFARYCNRKEQVINKTQDMLKIALQLQPENSHFQSEAAFQKSMQGDYATAFGMY